MSESVTPRKRVFVFKGPRHDQYDRPMLYAFREDQIQYLKSQWGSQNCYLEINGVRVDASFDEVVDMLGERVDMTGLP